MPKTQNTEAKMKKKEESGDNQPSPLIPPTLTLGPENAIKGEKKTDKIYFSDIRQNGKSGVFTNIISCTLEEQPTLVTFGSNKYINIELNDMFEQFLNGLYNRLDPEYANLVNDQYQIDVVLESYKDKGYVKCKIDLEKFNSSFFSTVEKDKENKRIVKPLKNADFQFDKITNGVYTLKVTGLWRKESQVGGRLQTTHSGLTIKVLNVLVNGYSSSDIDEDDEYEESIFTQLKEDSLNLLSE